MPCGKDTTPVKAANVPEVKWEVPKRGEAIAKSGTTLQIGQSHDRYRGDITWYEKQRKQKIISRQKGDSKHSYWSAKNAICGARLGDRMNSWIFSVNRLRLSAPMGVRKLSDVIAEKRNKGKRMRLSFPNAVYELPEISPATDKNRHCRKRLKLSASHGVRKSSDIATSNRNYWNRMGLSFANSMYKLAEVSTTKNQTDSAGSV